MKNIFITTLTISLFFVPQVTFATWWNPSTWTVSNKTSKTKVQKEIVVSPVPENTHQRKEVLRSTVEKVSNKKADGQTSVTKKKTNPAKKIIAPKSKPTPKTQPISSASNIKEKIGHIVQIICPLNGGTSLGTGSIIYGISANDSKILTNKHVLDGATGPCGIYKTQNYENAPILYFQSGSTFIFSTEYDLAIITPDVKTLNSYPNTNFQFNRSTDVFDKGVWVLGYPPSAGNNITLTKGVVSGSENMNGIVMYKTDAKIDNGNSGGAVFDEDGKFMGVPTLAAQGNYSSYGYIIPSQIVKTFLDIVEQEGYGKQNWQHPQLNLYAVSPLNTVLGPAPQAPQNPAQLVAPEIKIEKCKTVAKQIAQTLSDAVYKETYDNLFSLYYQRCKPDDQTATNQTFLERIQSLNLCMETSGDLAKSAANKEADTKFQSSYSSFYLNCLNK